MLTKTYRMCCVALCIEDPRQMSHHQAIPLMIPVYIFPQETHLVAKQSLILVGNIQFCDQALKLITINICMCRHCGNELVMASSD